MVSPTPTLETVISAIKTEMEAVSGVGTILNGDHTFEDDLEFIETNGYISSGSMDLWLIELRDIAEPEGRAAGEIYSRYTLEARNWSLRTNDASWSSKARVKAEAVRDKLARNAKVFRIGGQVQLITPETVEIESHEKFLIDGTDGPQLIYRTVLVLRVEARRFGNIDMSNPTYEGATASTDVFGTKVTGDTGRRLNVNADGSHEWGDGSGSYDVTFARGSAGRGEWTNHLDPSADNTYDVGSTTKGWRDGRFARDLYVAGLTASRLVGTDGGSPHKLASVSDLTAWIAGTSNQVVVSDDGDGTATLSLPQSIHTGASPTFTGLTLSGLAASRVVSTNGSSGLVSVPDLTSWVAGTANQITSTDDGDGTITLSLPSTLIAPGSIQCTTTVMVGGTDVILTRDAANTLAQRNAANGQALRVYGTFTDAMNYERLAIACNTTSASIVHQIGGTGTSRELVFGTSGASRLRFYTNNTNRVEITSDGHHRPMTDNAIDSGGASNSWRTGYFGTALAVGTTPATTGEIRLPNAGTISWRNAADNGNLGVIFVDSSDVLNLAFASGQKVGVANHASALLGFFAVTPVGRRLGGVTITNNITAGGTTNQLDDWTDLTTYATDAAAIRNAVYQLGRKQKLIVDALRTIGLCQNADA